MANIAKHTFVSPVADDGDVNTVSPSNWNAEHVFSGGTNGQILSYDSTQSDHVKWVANPQPFYDIRTFGGSGDGVLNNTPAWNAAIAAINATIGTDNFSGGFLYFPPGRYLFNSKPNELYGGISLLGAGVSRSVLIRNYTEADVRNGFIDMNVLSGFTNPCIIRDIQFYAATGTTGGSAINMESSTTVAQGDVTINNIYITGVGTFNYGIRCDGQLKTAAPQGVRSIHVTDSIIFQYTTAGIIMLAVNSCGISKTGLFETAGAPSVASLVIDGGGSVPTNYVNADLIFCPTARIGAALTTNQVTLTAPNITTLTVSAALSNFTFMGNVATMVGTPSTGSAGVGLATHGKILAGGTTPTAGGAKLETADSLTFPPSPIASSNASTLDGYLEASFTPVIQGTSTAGAGTYSIQEGTYTKIGNIVAISVRLVWSAHTGTGNMIITGFPWAAKGGNYTAPLACGYTNFLVGAGLELHPLLTGLQIGLFADDPAGGANVAVAMDTAGNLSLNGTYLTP